MKSTYWKYDPPRALFFEPEVPSAHLGDPHAPLGIADVYDVLLLPTCDALEFDTYHCNTHVPGSSDDEYETPHRTIDNRFHKVPFNLGKANNWTSRIQGHMIAISISL
jgi:hypothetical protein